MQDHANHDCEREKHEASVDEVYEFKSKWHKCVLDT